MLYFDLRLFIFFIQDWKMLMSCIAIALTFAFSGKQRTEILFRTKAYNLKHISGSSSGLESEEDDDDVETVRGYKSWKSVILIYEVAQTLSLFHTIMFFAFWYSDTHNYYFNIKEPKTDTNRYMRVIVMWGINTLPPMFMLFDMVFSKILFRLRHFWVGLLASAIFLGIQTLGSRVILRFEFPSDFERLPEFWHKVAAVFGFVMCHVVLWGISKIKVKLVKDPSYFKKDRRLENIIKRYDKFLKAKEAKRLQTNSRYENYDELMETQLIEPDYNPQLKFMKEVLYNYLDKELKDPRRTD